MTNALNIIVEFDKAFKAAIANPDNYTKKVVDWDFIEADVYIDLSNLSFTMAQINAVVDEEMPLAAEDFVGLSFEEAN
jgi:hypothetical protein